MLLSPGKNVKWSGIPMVASQIWKLLFPVRPDLFYSITKASLDSHTFPDKWKKATVIPIPKVSKPLAHFTPTTTG